MEWLAAFLEGMGGGQVDGLLNVSVSTAPLAPNCVRTEKAGAADKRSEAAATYLLAGARVSPPRQASAYRRNRGHRGDH